MKINFDSHNIFNIIKSKIEISDLNTDEIIQILGDSIENSSIFSSSIAVNSQVIACTGSFCPEDFFESIEMLIMFNFNTEKMICFHCTHYSENVLFSPDEKLLVQAVEDNPVRIYNAQTGELIRTLDHQLYYPDILGGQDEKCIAFNHDGNILATSDYHGRIFLWNLETGKLLQILSAFSSKKYKRYDSIYFAIDDTTLVAIDNYGHMDRWEINAEVLKS